MSKMGGKIDDVDKRLIHVNVYKHIEDNLFNLNFFIPHV